MPSSILMSFLFVVGTETIYYHLGNRRRNVKFLALIGVLCLTSCSAQPDVTDASMLNSDDISLIQTNREEAVAKGILTATEPYYPQPDFSEERLFKVTDQFGCNWWATIGHKFDHTWIVLTDKKIPDCLDQKYAPDKTISYVDKNNQAW